MGKQPPFSKSRGEKDCAAESVSRILPLAWLAPDISMAILEGCQPSDLSAKTLRDLPYMPLDWEKQREILGFPHL
ncbi:hypothetical protein [Roseovarius phycicola]|uniref:hypothetical protein n=1 Tax=Roseovarius phycicola TaxID=3080976 RepID=UPI0030D04692